MKKHLLILLCALVLLSAAFAAGCTKTVYIEVTPQPEVTAQAEQEQITPEPADQSQPTQAPADNKQPSTPTPEPTQQFVDDDAATPTAKPTAKKKATVEHDDLLGWWYLTELNGADVSNDVIFYEITLSMMNTLPYGYYLNYDNYNYTFNNGNINFGNGAYEVIRDQDVMIFKSKKYADQMVLQPVTQEDIDKIMQEKDPSGSPGNAKDDTPKYSTRCGRNGYPHLEGEFVECYAKEEMLSFLTTQNWTLYGYMYSDYTVVHDFAVYDEFDFDSNTTFTHTHTFGVSTGTYEIADGKLLLYYDDGRTTIYNTVYMEYNYELGYFFLYISDEQDGFEGNRYVYEG